MTHGGKKQNKSQQNNSVTITFKYWKDYELKKKTIFFYYAFFT